MDWKIVFTCLVMAIFATNVSVSGKPRNSQDDENNLYVNDTYIGSVTEKNFEQSIKGKPYVILFHFYSHNCPHCIRKAPQLKKFAREIDSWAPAVKILAANCMTQPRFCSRHSVKFYPSFWLIPANFDSQEFPDLIHLETNDNIRTELIRFIMTQPTVMNKLQLGATQVQTKEDICRFFSHQDRVRASFGILENESGTSNSFESVLVMLDLRRYRNSIQIRRFYGDASLAKSLDGISGRLPAMFELEINQNNCFFRIVSTYNPDDVAKFHEETTEHVSRMFPDEVESDKEELPPLGKEPPRYNVTFVDLFNTIRIALVDEMKRFTKFDNRQLNIIKDMYSVIHQHFPFRDENVRRLFKRMNIWFAKKDNWTELKQINYHETVRISDGFLRPKEPWRHCMGSSPHLRRYPCGLWTLFHTLTVNEYVHYMKDIGVKKNVSMPHESLRVMVRYIPQFFGCRECSTHFEESTRDFESHLTHANSSILYLWQLHNMVSARLAGDITEDPFFPKVAFPPQELCRDCVDTDNRFNEERVLNFLLDYYSETTIVRSSKN